MKLALPLVCLMVTLLHAQAVPTFEVASVKPHPWAGGGRVGIFVRGDTLTGDHTCLYGLVEFAYNLRDNHLSGGPPWSKCGVLASSDLYQVIAKAAGDPPPPMDQFRLMLQALLADRFQLRVHHIQKDLPIYNLVTAPHGAKLKESSGDGKFGFNMDARPNHGKSVRMTVTHATIAQLLGQFEGAAGRPLYDHTELKGTYDLEFAWDVEMPVSATPETMGPDMIGQSFAVALEKQLGLRLEPGTAPFDTVVIDHAEKPSGN